MHPTANCMPLETEMASGCLEMSTPTATKMPWRLRGDVVPDAVSFVPIVNLAKQLGSLSVLR